MMSNLSNKKLILISFLSLLIAGLSFFFSFRNVALIGNKQIYTKKDLKAIKKRIDLKTSNINLLDEKILALNKQKSKNASLEKQLSSLDYDSDTSKNIDYFNNIKLNPLLINLSDMRLLKASDQTSKEEENSATDLLISSITYTDNYYSVISEKIIENNNRINKIIGELSYNKKSNNSLLKSTAYKNINSDYLNNKLDQESLDFTESVLFLKESFFNTYLSSVSNVDNKNISESRLNLEAEKQEFSSKNLVDNSGIYQKMVESYVFLLDTYAENEGLFEKLNLASKKVSNDAILTGLLIRDQDNIIRIEKEDADANYEYFYYDYNSNIIYSIDTSDFSSKYYDINKIDDEYKKALNLLSSF